MLFPKWTPCWHAARQQCSHFNASRQLSPTHLDGSKGNELADRDSPVLVTLSCTLYSRKNASKLLSLPPTAISIHQWLHTMLTTGGDGGKNDAWCPGLTREQRDLFVSFKGGSLKQLYSSEPAGELLMPSHGREDSHGSKSLPVQKLVKFWKSRAAASPAPPKPQI